MVTRPFAAYQGDQPYVFVSYAHEDADAVYEEIARLNETGFNVWYDEGISPGNTWRDDVALALTQCSVFLYFVTPRSVASDNCAQELNFALSRERKVLAVFLEPTELPIGVELALGNKQAIIRGDHVPAAYRDKLSQSLRALLPRAIEPIPMMSASMAAPDDSKSIAVLPFANRSADATNEHLCDGIAEELILGLSSLPGLRVASQLSAFALKGQNLTVETTGHRLKVDHVLNGSVQRSGDRVRVTVLVSRVSDGITIWSERYDRQFGDIFELQEEVAQQVVKTLEVELTGPAGRPLLNIGTDNVRAYEELLLGQRERRVRTPQAIERAIRHFERSVDLDPQLGRAWYELLVCYQMLASFGRPLEPMLPMAQAAIERGRATGYAPYQPWSVAERNLKRKGQIDPHLWVGEAASWITDPDSSWREYGFCELSMVLSYAGFLQGALQYAEYYHARAQPSIDDYFLWLGLAFLRAANGRFDLAIALWSDYIAVLPDDGEAHAQRSILYSRTGQFEEAQADLAVARATWPRNTYDCYHLFWSDRQEEARTESDWLLSRKNLPPNMKRMLCFLFGEMEMGFDFLEEELASIGGFAYYVRPSLRATLPPSRVEEIERHPRFEALQRHYGLGESWRDEVLAAAEKLTPVTGIVVRPDDA